MSMIGKEWRKTSLGKKKSIYECQHCGAQYPRWQGQCLECNKWNTLIEETLAPSSLS